MIPHAKGNSFTIYSGAAQISSKIPTAVVQNGSRSSFQIFAYRSVVCKSSVLALVLVLVDVDVRTRKNLPVAAK